MTLTRKEVKGDRPDKRAALDELKKEPEVRLNCKLPESMRLALKRKVLDDPDHKDMSDVVRQLIAGYLNGDFKP